MAIVRWLSVVTHDVAYVMRRSVKTAAMWIALRQSCPSFASTARRTAIRQEQQQNNEIELQANEKKVCLQQKSNVFAGKLLLPAQRRKR
jgi:hypothetical protein